MKKVLFSLMLIAALSAVLCVGAFAFDWMNPPEPGAAEGYVCTKSEWSSSGILPGHRTTESSYTYDQYGRIATRTDVIKDTEMPELNATEVYQYKWDDQNRLDSTVRSDGNHLMLYSYNTDGTHYVTYSWIDEDGQHNSNVRTYDPCEDWYWFGKWHFDYDHEGNTVARWTDDGEKWIYENYYDESGWLYKVVMTDAHKVQQTKLLEKLDRGGYRVTWSSTTGAEIFTYDASGRLVQYEDQYSDAPVWEYFYDANGNNISRSLNDGSAKMTYTYQQGKTNSAPNFTDVKQSDYFYDAVDWAVKKGVTNGTSATTFSPNQACTRAQAVTFLWRAAGSPEPHTVNSPFTDVQNPGAYYFKAVLWATDQKITNGMGNGRFGVDAPCTRAQIVTFLWRMHGSPKVNLSGAIPGDIPVPFSDVPPNAYYFDAVWWAVGKKVTQGTGKTTFSPDDDCTRAQIVTFLYRDLG